MSKSNSSTSILIFFRGGSSLLPKKLKFASATFPLQNSKNFGKNLNSFCSDSPSDDDEEDDEETEEDEEYGDRRMRKTKRTRRMRMTIRTRRTRRRRADDDDNGSMEAQSPLRNCEEPLHTTVHELKVHATANDNDENTTVVLVSGIC